MDGIKASLYMLDFEERDVIPNRENKESVKRTVRSHGMLASELQ